MKGVMVLGGRKMLASSKIFPHPAMNYSQKVFIELAYLRVVVAAAAEKFA